MFDDKNLLQTDPYGVNSSERDMQIDYPQKPLESSRLSQNISLESAKTQSKRFIQTKAQKGASQLSKKLRGIIFDHSSIQRMSYREPELHSEPSPLKLQNIIRESSDSTIIRPSTASEDIIDFSDRNKLSSNISKEFIDIPSWKNHLLMKGIDTKLDHILSQLSSRGPKNTENSLRTNSSGKTYTLDLYNFGNKTSDTSTEDLFLKKIHEYRAIHQKVGYTGIESIPEEPIQEPHNQKNLGNKAKNKETNSRYVRSEQKTFQNSAKNNRALSNEPSLKIKQKNIVHKPKHNQSDLGRRSLVPQKENNRSINSEKKVNLSPNKVDSSFFRFKNNEKVIINPINDYLSSKQVFLNRKKPSNLEKASHRDQQTRERRKNTEEDSKDTLHPLIQMNVTKKPDPKELREKYTRQYIHFQDKPKKKIEDYSIFTLGEIQTKNNKNLDQQNRSMIEKNFWSQGKSDIDYSLLANQWDSFAIMNTNFHDLKKVPNKNIGVHDKVAFDKGAYQNISELVSKISSLLSSQDFDENIERLIKELKRENNLFQKISFRCLKEMLKGCNIVTIKNQNLYSENETNEYCYLVLYGQVYLKTKGIGVYTECFAGQTLAEEALLENNFRKKETAQILEETALLELTCEFFEDLQFSPLNEDYIYLLTTLKKNFKQKKGLRTINIFS